MAVTPAFVLVPLATAAAWAPALRGVAADYRGRGQPLRPDAADLVEAFSAAEVAVRPRPSTGADAPAGAGAIAPPRQFTSSDVAALARVSTSAVRSAARERRLVGRLIGRGWIFGEPDVTAWLASRGSAGATRG